MQRLSSGACLHQHVFLIELGTQRCFVFYHHMAVDGFALSCLSTDLCLLSTQSIVLQFHSQYCNIFRDRQNGRMYQCIFSPPRETKSQTTMFGVQALEVSRCMSLRAVYLQIAITNESIQLTVDVLPCGKSRPRDLQIHKKVVQLTLNTYSKTEVSVLAKLLAFFAHYPSNHIYCPRWKGSLWHNRPYPLTIPHHIHYMASKYLCKLLWVSASAKCQNVNVYV